MRAAAREPIVSGYRIRFVVDRRGCLGRRRLGRRSPALSSMGSGSAQPQAAPARRGDRLHDAGLRGQHEAATAPAPPPARAAARAACGTSGAGARLDRRSRLGRGSICRHLRGHPGSAQRARLAAGRGLSALHRERVRPRGVPSRNRFPFAPRTGQLKKGARTASAARSVAVQAIWAQHGLQPTANARGSARRSAACRASRRCGRGRRPASAGRGHAAGRARRRQAAASLSWCLNAPACSACRPRPRWRRRRRSSACTATRSCTTICRPWTTTICAAASRPCTRPSTNGPPSWRATRC